MLSCLQVKDFAIITSSALELQPGMTTLTGETGAGKSILLGALGLVLGDRATPRAVRESARRAEITAIFDLEPGGKAEQWLQAQSLDQDGECILRRVVNADGKSRAYINGNAVTVRNLRELGQHLVNIHGQHDHQRITEPETQLQILDDFGNCTKELSAVASAWQQWHTTQSEVDDFSERVKTRSDRLDVLNFQLQELASLPLDTLDFTALDDEHRRLANATELRAAVDRLGDTLQHNENSILAQLALAESASTELSSADGSCADIGNLIVNGRIQLEEAADALRHYQHTIEPDPQRLQELEDILGIGHKLCKKHQVDASELAPLASRLQTERETLQSMDSSLRELENQLQQALQHYQKHAAKLTRKRQKAATQLASHLGREMTGLGMKGGRFEIELSARKSDRPHSDGNDSALFQVSANPGAAPMPMHEVASGGELSRLSLAVQLIRSTRHQVPTMIFDEVDTGVGGGVAETVGKQLRALGQRCQVICVTHLPQVAAQGHHHIKVTKLASDNKTLAETSVLTEEQSLEEIARMLGGVKITRRTREHAREMVAAASEID